MLSRQVAFCASLIIALPAAAQDAVTPVAPYQAPPSPVLQASLSEPKELQTAASADDSSSTTPAGDRVLLKQKLTELDRLQSEVDQLRQASGDVPQILVRFKIVEINKTKLRQLGIKTNLRQLGMDLTSFDGSLSKNNGLPESEAKKGQTFDFNIVTGDKASSFLHNLQQVNLARVLAEPNLVVLSGRQASFNAGGEFPVPADTVANKPFHFQKFGTEVDIKPMILGNGKVRLDFRTRISEPDNAHSITISGTQVPGLTVREVQSGCELLFGQTAVLGGLIQERTETHKTDTGIKDVVNEIQLLVFITPEKVAPLR